MEHLEIEVKFHLSDVGPIRNRILKIGAECTGRVFETNIRLENEDKNLIKQKSLLRLRKDSKTTLTFKSEPCHKDQNFKVLEELEVCVSDFSTMLRILESLGFHNEQIYEKWREIFSLHSTSLCIDSMPYGDFLEIEGKKEEIKDLACRLGLKWEKRILCNYLELFEFIKQKLNLPFSDVTFSRFQNIKVDLAAYLHRFEAGH